MKVLFICRANVGRSQMAEAIFNKLSKEDAAISAGLNPGKWEGEKISQAKSVVLSLSEIGCDVSKKVSKRLTKKMTEGTDKIVVLGEKENWPDYLKESDNVVFWDIEDPAHKDLDSCRMIRDRIKEKVEVLLN